MSAARGAAGPPGAEGHGYSFGRAAVLVAAAAGLAVYLLSLGTPVRAKPTASEAPTTAPASPPPATSPATSRPASTSTTTPPAAKSNASTSVKVLVANASQTNGVATSVSQKLAAAGWGTLAPVTALTTESASSVYYATGQQAAAQAVAASLGIAATSVQALGGSVVPVGAGTLRGADVVVVVGDDLAARVTAAG